MFCPFFPTQPTQKEQEIVAEDDQIFLIKLKTQLSQQVPSNSNTVSVVLISGMFAYLSMMKLTDL